MWVELTEEGRGELKELRIHPTCLDRGKNLPPNYFPPKWELPLVESFKSLSDDKRSLYFFVLKIKYCLGKTHY